MTRVEVRGEQQPPLSAQRTQGKTAVALRRTRKVAALQPNQNCGTRHRLSVVLCTKVLCGTLRYNANSTCGLRDSFLSVRRVRLSCP